MATTARHVIPSKESILKKNLMPAFIPGKPLTAAIALALCACAAQAQDSGVQLFGTVAISGVHLSNQANGNGSSMVAGPWTAPSFGLRGKENMGGGLTTSFQFESTLDATQGLGGKTVAGTSKFWDKAAWVGLGNKDITVTAGRQLHAGIDRIVLTLDPFYANADGKMILSTLALNATNTFGGYDTRVDNAFKVRATLPANIQAGMSYGFATEGKFGRSISADLGWQTKEVGLGAYVFNYKDATGQLEQQVWGLGGNYLVGPVRLYVHYMNAHHDKLTGVRQSDSVWALGAAYPITASITLRGAYYRDSGKDIGGAAGASGKRSTFALLGDYNFSKRTSLNIGVFHNGLSGAFMTDPTSLAVLGLVNPATKTISGSSNTGFAVGLTHRF